MICVAANAQSSFANIEKWRSEIIDIEPERPIALILTKSDLADMSDNPVTIDMMRAKSK